VDGGLSGSTTGSLPLDALTNPGVTGGGLSTLGPTSTTVPNGVSTAASKTLQSAPAYEIEKGPGVGSVYLMLALAGLGMLVISQAVRYLAVRLALGGQGRW
jgi:hypothetical protein